VQQHRRQPSLYFTVLFSQVAAPVVEYMYSTWASAFEKSQLRQEFYGDMYKQDKESNVHSLDDVFQKTPTMKQAVLSAVKANVSQIIDKSVSTAC
jgi:pumilio family protein 6